MTEIRRYSLAAIILLVVLRLAIGWQLLYEGLWKIDTLKSPRPWTSSQPSSSGSPAILRNVSRIGPTEFFR